MKPKSHEVTGLPLDPADWGMTKPGCTICSGCLPDGEQCLACGRIQGRVFTNCNVCGRQLHGADEDRMGMCERCAEE